MRPTTNVSHAINSFVVVNPERSTADCPFWLGRVDQVHRSDEGDVANITVRWYEVNGGQTVFEGVYKPCFTRDMNLRRVAWRDTINTDSVMFTLRGGLTEQQKLGQTTVRSIKYALQSHA